MYLGKTIAQNKFQPLQTLVTSIVQTYVPSVQLLIACKVCCKVTQCSIQRRAYFLQAYFVSWHGCWHTNLSEYRTQNKMQFATLYKYFISEKQNVFTQSISHIILRNTKITNSAEETLNMKFNVVVFSKTSQNQQHIFRISKRETQTISKENPFIHALMTIMGFPVVSENFHDWCHKN